MFFVLFLCSDRHAVVYGEHLSGDPGDLIRGEKADGVGLILHGALGHIVQGHMAVALGGKICIKGGIIFGRIVPSDWRGRK